MSKASNSNKQATAEETKASAVPSFGELDRLRDILYGEHARDVSTQIVELRDHINGMGDSQAKLGESRQHELKTQLADLEATLVINKEQAHNELEKLNQMMTVQQATQRQMGEMLIKLGQRLLED